MTMRNAIIAAWAGLLALTAGLAYAGEPIPGVDIELGKHYDLAVGKGKKVNPDRESKRQKSGADSAKRPISDQGTVGGLTTQKPNMKADFTRDTFHPASKK